MQAVKLWNNKILYFLTEGCWLSGLKLYHFLRYASNCIFKKFLWCYTQQKPWLKFVDMIYSTSVLWHCWLGGRQGIRPVKNMGGWWRWALVSLDGVVPSRMVGVSASVNLPLHHKVQKFCSGTGSPGWSRKRAVKRLWLWCGGYSTRKYCFSLCTP